MNLIVSLLGAFRGDDTEPHHHFFYLVDILELYSFRSNRNDVIQY
jgi:hypothetical protein